MVSLACDNVLAYEVVLANGTITTVSPSNKPDLCRALNGGSNNFAIVTTFDLTAFEYKLIQGGLNIYNGSAAVRQGMVNAFEYFAQNGPEDSDADMFMALSNISGVPSWIIVEPIFGVSLHNRSLDFHTLHNHPPFRRSQLTRNTNYTATLNASLTFSTRRTSTHGNFATEFGTTQPSGKREQFHTGTYTSDAQLMNDIYDFYRPVVAQV